MKLGILVNSKVALESLLGKDINAGISWELKKFLKVVNPELTSFDEVKNDTIKQFGEEVLEDEKPTGKIRVKDEYMNEFMEILNSLLDKELDIKIPQIKIGDLKDVKISAKDLMILEWLITE